MTEFMPFKYNIDDIVICYSTYIGEIVKRNHRTVKRNHRTGDVIHGAYNEYTVNHIFSLDKALHFNSRDFTVTKVSESAIELIDVLTLLKIREQFDQMIIEITNKKSRKT